jgi:hypothetical protein
MDELYLMIVTGRHDGCFVNISWDSSPNREIPDVVHVKLLSYFNPDEELANDVIPTRDVVQWINDHRDW